MKSKRQILFIALLLVLSITSGCAKEDSLTDNASQISTETQTEVENDTSSETNSETENNSSVNKDNDNIGQTSSKQELRPGETGDYRVSVIENDWYTVTYKPYQEGFVQINVTGSDQTIYFSEHRMPSNKEAFGSKRMGDWDISMHCDGTLYEIIPGPAPCCIYKGTTDVPYGMTEGLTQEEIEALEEEFLCGIWACEDSKYLINAYIHIEDGITEEMALEILRNIQVSPM